MPRGTPLTFVMDNPQVLEARQRSVRIGKSLDDLATLVQEAWDKQDHLTLGYESWQAYTVAEFGRGDVAVKARQIVTAMLRGTGLSQRAIAEQVGVSNMTVSNDLADMASPTAQHVVQLVNGESSENNSEQSPPVAVVGNDGRVRPAATGGMSGEERRERRRVVRNRTLGEVEMEEIIAGDLTRGQIRDRFNVGEHVAQLARTAAIAIKEERARAAASPPPRSNGNGRHRNWNGTTNAARARQLREERQGEAYLELVAVQTRVSQMCSVLQDIHIEEYGLGDVEDEKILDIYDDLITLGEWHDRTIGAIQRRLNDTKVLAKITKLRDTTGRTAEEAQTALRLAERLERKLQNRITT